MQDTPSSPPPTGRRSCISLCSGVVGMMLGGTALALLFERFRDSCSGNVWEYVGVGVIWGFCTGRIVGRRVAAIWKSKKN